MPFRLRRIVHTLQNLLRSKVEPPLLLHFNEEPVHYDQLTLLFLFQRRDSCKYNNIMFPTTVYLAISNRSRRGGGGGGKVEGKGSISPSGRRRVSSRP